MYHKLPFMNGMILATGIFSTWPVLLHGINALLLLYGLYSTCSACWMTVDDDVVVVWQDGFVVVFKMKEHSNVTLFVQVCATPNDVQECRSSSDSPFSSSPESSLKLSALREFLKSLMEGKHWLSVIFVRHVGLEGFVDCRGVLTHGPHGPNKGPSEVSPVWVRNLLTNTLTVRGLVAVPSIEKHNFSIVFDVVEVISATNYMLVSNHGCRGPNFILVPRDILVRWKCW